MADESFMLLSLKENQSKKLAQVIGNETCRAILEYLTEKEYATETETANELKMPLSTVHYNMRALLASGLVIADEYHYSGKGKEVPHYKLAKKFIIIAPKDEKNLFDKLKKFIPITLISIGLATAYEFISRLINKPAIIATDALMKAAPMAMEYSADAAAGSAPETMRLMADETVPLITQAAHPSIISPVAGWFLVGALFVIFAMIIYEFVKKQ